MKKISDAGNYIKSGSINRISQRFFMGIFFTVLFSMSCFATPQKNMKVMSYNIHYGRGMDDKYDLELLIQSMG